MFFFQALSALLLVAVAATAAHPGYGYHTDSLYEIPKNEELGTYVGKHTLPPKIIRIVKTVAVKVPVPYPVKVPYPVRVPVHVPQPYPVHVQKLVKVHEPYPVHTDSKSFGSSDLGQHGHESNDFSGHGGSSGSLGSSGYSGQGYESIDQASYSKPDAGFDVSSYQPIASGLTASQEYKQYYPEQTQSQQYSSYSPSASYQPEYQQQSQQQSQQQYYPEHQDISQYSSAGGIEQVHSPILSETPKYESASQNLEGYKYEQH